MSSFEVDYDDVVQKIRESEGAKDAKYDHISPLLNVFFFCATFVVKVFISIHIYPC